jgi:RND family efflux transporter MFP subunit
VTVSAPIQQDVDTRLQFLGQFSAVDQVELRAQVGGTLTQIGFKDGDVVHKGDLLFTIDPTPYQIKLSEATAQLESARARLDFANREAFRADTMKQTGYGSVETADQRAADRRAAPAGDNAEAPFARSSIRSHPHHRAFTGRIGTNSLGRPSDRNAADNQPFSSPRSSIDRSCSFDMSEADYMKFKPGGSHRPATCRQGKGDAYRRPT